MSDNEVKDEIVRRYIKGDIIEKELAYNTAKSHILDRLEMELTNLFNKIKNEDGLK